MRGIETGVWATKIRSGDLRALAQAATAVENQTPAAAALLKELFPHTGKAIVIGITGAPGAGKSTLADQMARLLRKQLKQVGIIAIDPTSPFTGGAILGDRIRMQSHHTDAGVFIRSMATRGWLGGLARATTDMTLLLDAAGRDAVLVETVGVGQDEVEIARLADVTIVTLMPGAGDDVQAIKAGIMEIADVFVINKADQPGADRLEREIRANISLAMRPDHWLPPVVRTIACEGKGTEEALNQTFRFLERGRSHEREVALWNLRLKEMLRERLLERFSEADFSEAAVEVSARRRDPYTVVDQLMSSLDHE